MRKDRRSANQTAIILEGSIMKSRIHGVLMSVMAAALMWSAMGGERARAQSSTPREETWVTNGTVNAIVQTSDTLYIGGSFTYVGPVTGNGVPRSTPPAVWPWRRFPRSMERFGPPSPTARAAGTSAAISRGSAV